MRPSLSALLCLFFVIIGFGIVYLIAYVFGIKDISELPTFLWIIIIGGLIAVSVGLVRDIETPEGGKTPNEIIKNRESVDRED